MKETAPTEAVGCILFSGQEVKMEILVNLLNLKEGLC